MRSSVLINGEFSLDEPGPYTYRKRFERLNLSKKALYYLEEIMKEEKIVYVIRV